MRPPPFQPPTQGLPRVSRADLAAASGVIDGAGAGPRMTDPNPPGLESVGPRQEEVRRSRSEQRQQQMEADWAHHAPNRRSDKPAPR